MIPLINQAIAYGYTASQILGFISSKIPNMGTSVKNARKTGYDDEDILKFLQGKIKTSRKTSDEPRSAISKSMYNADLKTREERNEEKAKWLKSAVGVAGTALGAYQMYSGYKGLMGGLQRMQQPRLPGPGANQPPPFQGTTLQGPSNPRYYPNAPQPNVPRGTPPGPQPTPSPQVQTPGQAIGAQVHAPGTTPNVPPAPQAPKVDSKAIFQQMGLEDKIQNLQKVGNGPEQIAAALQISMRPEQKKWLESQTQQPLTEIVNDYLTQQPQQAQQMIDPLKEPGQFPNRGSAPQGQPAIQQEVPKIESKPLIATKSGDIGEIRGEDSTGKLIDVDGKVRKFKDDEIIESPLPEKDLADLYDDLIGGIQGKTGQEVSRNVYWAGYDPKTNELLYIPHGGRAYNYDDISPEDVEELTNLLSRRKTSGENYIGAWTEGTNSPIGAAMHKLIMKLQKARGGKGNEYKNRFETIYDALEPAKQAAKKKHAKRKK
jgi:hypothetical protein